jgi:hypothetical protein
MLLYRKQRLHIVESQMRQCCQTPDQSR